MNITSINEELFSYIKKSPTAYHAVETSSSLLLKEGFIQLQEQDSWNLTAGGKYFITRGQSAILAFRMPSSLPTTPLSFQIVASHSDSPCFKLKEQAEMAVENHYTKLNVERYGGSILSTWFDRPLSIAGRALVQEDDKITSRLVNLDQDLAMIVNLAIHMNRGVNNGTPLHIQTDLLPLIGSGKKDFSVKSLVAEKLQVKEEQILSMDLSLYNRMDCTFWGAEQEFISGPRLDDLQCAFSSIKALSGTCHPETVSVAVIFDTEEVGSQSRQGACSTFLKECLERISMTLGYTKEEHLRSLAGSFLLSADNGHALHPNYTGKSNPENHPYVNEGLLVKYSANQKYTSDSVTGGIFRTICKNHQIPCQTFYNHSDEPGGSTLGNLSMSQASIPTVDIGTPMLAMHSAYETAGAKDTLYLVQAMEAFYQTHICCLGDGQYQLSTLK